MDPPHSPTSDPTTSDSNNTVKTLNIHGLIIRPLPNKDRCVFSSRPIPARTLIEISPVLLFTPEEWDSHARHTVLDHYTFVWHVPGESRPSLALALGLGSIFNHSSRPNVSFFRNVQQQTIEYTTTRDIQAGEELCISYGDPARLWFPVVGDVPQPESEEEEDGEWGGLGGLELDEVQGTTRGEGQLEESVRGKESQVHQGSTMAEEQGGGSTMTGAEEEPWMKGDPDEVIPADQLPFKRIKSLEELEEDETEGIKTMDAWVVDIPDPRLISSLLKYMKDQELDHPSLAHLRRIKKTSSNKTILLLSPASSSPSSPSSSPSAPPPLPPALEGAEPYLLPVPKHPPKDQPDFLLKNPLWPVEPPTRPPSVRLWTRRQVAWVYHGLRRAVEAAKEAGKRGEVPIGAYVCSTPGEEQEEGEEKIEVVGTDRRKSEGHPLRHAVMAAIRGVADIRVAASTSSTSGPGGTSSSVPTAAALEQPSAVQDSPAQQSTTSSSRVPSRADTPSTVSATPTAKNGASYLLTSLTLFTTHEPCIMCSMALVHSRVKDVFYIHPMSGTGGCGGAEGSVGTGVVGRGVNHRFGVWRWRGGGLAVEGVEEGLDA